MHTLPNITNFFGWKSGWMPEFGVSSGATDFFLLHIGLKPPPLKSLDDSIYDRLFLEGKREAERHLKVGLSSPVRHLQQTKIKTQKNLFVASSLQFFFSQCIHLLTKLRWCRPIKKRLCVVLKKLLSYFLKNLYVIENNIQYIIGL